MRGTLHREGAYIVRTMAPTFLPVRYGADFRAELLLVTARYFLDARTGFRPFLGLSIGQAHWTMTSDQPVTSLLMAALVDSDERLVVIVPGVGVQYIPFSSFPLTLAASAEGIIAGGAETSMIRAFSLGLGIRVGVIL
jgi:hypothetical protein